MAEKIKVLAPDATGNFSETIGENMDIRESKEPWSEYVIEDVFNELYEQWREKTKFHSYIGNTTDIYHEKIIQLGWRAVPFIINKLKEDHAHLFIALSRITGENPVKKENMGKIKKMAEDWIQWWEG